MQGNLKHDSEYNIKSRSLSRVHTTAKLQHCTASSVSLRAARPQTGCREAAGLQPGNFRTASSTAQLRKCISESREARRPAKSLPCSAGCKWACSFARRCLSANFKENAVIALADVQYIACWTVLYDVCICIYLCTVCMHGVAFSSRNVQLFPQTYINCPFWNKSFKKLYLLSVIALILKRAVDQSRTNKNKFKTNSHKFWFSFLFSLV